MKYCCQFCSTSSEFSTPCEVCGAVRVFQCQATDGVTGGNEKSSGGFWVTVALITGLGLLMQISAFFQ